MADIKTKPSEDNEIRNPKSILSQVRIYTFNGLPITIWSHTYTDSIFIYIRKDDKSLRVEFLEIV